VEDVQLALTATRVDQKNFGIWLRNWQVGQVLNALVASQRPSGELVLRVGGQQLTAATDVPVQPGTRLLLEVKQLEPVPVLRVLRSVPPPAGQAVETGGAVRAAATPGAPSLVSALQALGAEGIARLPGNAQVLIGQLLDLLPRLSQLGEARNLKRAVEQSGTFSEARLLASGGESAERDLKVLVQRLLVVLRGAGGSGEEAPSARGAGAFARELEGMLGALQLNQLASLPGDAGAGRSWRIDLPFLLGEGMHSARLSINEEEGRERPDGEELSRRWHAVLSLDLPRLGSLVVHVQAGPEQARVSIEVENPGSGALLGGSLHQLGDAMKARGLTLEGLEVRLGPEQGAAGSEREGGVVTGWKA
jgi:hypothetical protein